MARDHDGETALCLASRCASKTSAPPRLPHLVPDAAKEISSWEDRDEKRSAILGQLDMEYKPKQVHTITRLRAVYEEANGLPMDLKFVKISEIWICMLNQVTDYYADNQ